MERAGGERRIWLYDTSRRPAGEKLERRLTQRELGRSKPVVRSDAVSRNNAAEDARIRCQCLAQGRRKFRELAEACPAERGGVVNALTVGFDPDEYARAEQRTAPERRADPQRKSGPPLRKLPWGLVPQTAQRRVEPKSRLGKAIASRLSPWDSRTRFLHEPGASIDNTRAARARKLAMRQRKTSVFYAPAHRASIARVLPSVLAPWVQAGVTALEY